MSILNKTQDKFAYSKYIELVVEYYISNKISWSFMIIIVSKEACIEI